MDRNQAGTKPETENFKTRKRTSVSTIAEQTSMGLTQDMWLRLWKRHEKIFEHTHTAA